jgi:hypothetical protein
MTWDGKPLAVFVCLLASMPAAGAAPPPARDRSERAGGASVVALRQGRTTMVARFGTTRVRVTMLARQVALTGDWPPAHPKNDCTFSRSPCSLTDRFEIFVQGRRIALPRSATARLADLDTMQLSQLHRGRYRLRIHGGDADGSYAVVLLFDKDQLRERIDIWPEGAQVVDRIFYRRVGWKILEHVVRYKLRPLE